MEINIEGLTKDGKPVDKVREYLKCKMSALYFIENYCYAPVSGGMVKIGGSELWESTPKFRQFIKAMSEFDAVSLMASRQSGKTTNALFFYLHALLFFPKIQIEYVTLDSKRAQDAIKRVKEMLAALPEWLQIGFKGKSEKVTYLELENGSRMSASYVSGSIDPDKLGRGMSAPLIFVDEAAFIPKMDIVWAALQPSISAARVHAKRNGYPTNILLTSTPNGAGENFFYNVWQRAHDSSEVFKGDSVQFKENKNEILEKDKEKNNFVKFKIHWSETNKDDDWYQQQIKELNFNMRKVSQELDIVFLGSSNAVFPDEVLQLFKPAPIQNKITISYGETFELTSEIDPTRTYLLGVDTAASTALSSDYSAMVLIDAATGDEVGAWHGKFSVVKRFAVVVKSLIKGLTSLHSLTSDNLVVIIERNSFGLGTIEELLYDDEEFDYTSFVYHEILKNGDRRPGLLTNAKSRDAMFNFLLSAINEIPERAQSALLQEELRNLEQKNNGRFEAVQGAHDDVIMAYNFCLFVRHEMITSGLIEVDGRLSKYDLKRTSYFLEVTMSSAEPDISRSQKQEFFVINTTEKEDRKRILSEYGYDSSYESLPSLDNYIIGL